MRDRVDGEGCVPECHGGNEEGEEAFWSPDREARHAKSDRCEQVVFFKPH